MLRLPPSSNTDNNKHSPPPVTFVEVQSKLKLLLYLVGTPDSVKHAMTDVLHLIIGSVSDVHVVF